MNNMDENEKSCDGEESYISEKFKNRWNWLIGDGWRMKRMVITYYWFNFID